MGVRVHLNAVPPRGSLSDEGKEVIKSHGLETGPIVSYRHAFFHSLTAGLGVLENEPEGKAAEEIAQLYLHTCKHANIPTQTTGSGLTFDIGGQQ